MTIPDNYIKVLDKGYVGLVDTMGDEASIANAARVSFDKQTELNEDGTLKEKDARLIKFLVREGHWSPFRHAVLTFELYAPLMVCRQWVKHVVGSAHLDEGISHNESSRRYITEEPTFYIPAENEWRSAPENSKQGSGEPIPAVKNDGGYKEWDGRLFTGELERYIKLGEYYYKEALNAGVCAEQARLFLPAYGMYVRWRWTTSLQGVISFLGQRLEHDAQVEMQKFAQAVRELTEPKFPETMKAVREAKNESSVA